MLVGGRRSDRRGERASAFGRGQRVDQRARRPLGPHGLQLVRFPADLWPVSFAYLDPIVDGARLQGLNIYATVAYTPQWASSAPGCVPHSSDQVLSCDNKRPSDKALWAAAVSAVVSHYQGKVECWGIWNEPNLRGFFDGTLQQFVDEIFLPAAGGDSRGGSTGEDLRAGALGAHCVVELERAARHLPGNQLHPQWLGVGPRAAARPDRAAARCDYAAHVQGELRRGGGGAARR